MLGKVLTATVNLFLLRSGPQDFPFDPKLTGVLVPLTVLLSYLVQVMIYPPVVAAALALSVVIGLAFAVKTLLRIRNLEMRFIQTYHSLLVVNGLTTLALWPVMSVLAPALQRLARQPAVLESGGTLESSARLDLPTGPATLFLILAIWNFAASANIYNHAANLGPWRGVAVALMVTLALQMFGVMFAAMAAAVTGVPAAG